MLARKIMTKKIVEVIRKQMRKEREKTKKRRATESH
jgi:hypothetical protein